MFAIPMRVSTLVGVGCGVDLWLLRQLAQLMVVVEVHVVAGLLLATLVHGIDTSVLRFSKSGRSRMSKASRFRSVLCGETMLLRRASRLSMLLVWLDEKSLPPDGMLAWSVFWISSCESAKSGSIRLCASFFRLSMETKLMSAGFSWEVVELPLWEGGKLFSAEEHSVAVLLKSMTTSCCGVNKSPPVLSLASSFTVRKLAELWLRKLDDDGDDVEFWPGGATRPSAFRRDWDSVGVSAASESMTAADWAAAAACLLMMEMGAGVWLLRIISPLLPWSCDRFRIKGAPLLAICCVVTGVVGVGAVVSKRLVAAEGPFAAFCAAATLALWEELLSSATKRLWTRLDGRFPPPPPSALGEMRFSLLLLFLQFLSWEPFSDVHKQSGRDCDTFSWCSSIWWTMDSIVSSVWKIQWNIP